MTYPWEQLPEPAALAQPPAPASVDETVAALQRDFAYTVAYTAVLVHSNRPEFQMVVNTLRGQIVPRGQCRFTDGSTFELQDIAMPQPGAEVVAVPDLVGLLWQIASDLGLELQT